MTNHNQNEYLFPSSVRLMKSVPSPWELEKREREANEAKSKAIPTPVATQPAAEPKSQPSIELIENHDGEIVAYPCRTDS